MTGLEIAAVTLTVIIVMAIAESWIRIQRGRLELDKARLELDRDMYERPKSSFADDGRLDLDRAKLQLERDKYERPRPDLAINMKALREGPRPYLSKEELKDEGNDEG